MILRRFPSDLMNLMTIVLALMLVMPVAYADKIEVIQLHNRPVEEIIPLVGPMIKPGEAISGTGYKLILRASPETMMEVRRILAQIDTGVQNLMISVRQGDGVRSEQSDAALNAFYNSEQGGAISGHLSQGQVYDRSQLDQRVRVLEGGVAYIHTGTELYTPSITPSRKGHLGHETIRQSVGSGFYVAPRVNGNQVNLEISPYRESFTGYGNTIDTQSASTVTSGQLGEWIHIAGAGQTQQLKQRGFLSGTSANTARQSGIYVKVDVVD